MDFASMKLSACRVSASCAFFSAMLLSSGTASADERSELTDRIMATDPIPCINESHALFSKQLLVQLRNTMMVSSASAVRLNDDWKPGNPDYERVSALLTGAIAEGEAGPAPMFTHKSGADLIRSSFDNMPAADLRYAATFFAGPLGRTFWRYFVESATCKGILTRLKALPQLQTAPPPSLLAQPAAYEAQFKKDAVNLTPAQEKEFKQAAERLMPLITSYASPVKAGMVKERVKEIMAKHGDQIRAIMKPYQRAP